MRVQSVETIYKPVRRRYISTYNIKATGLTYLVQITEIWHISIMNRNPQRLRE